MMMMMMMMMKELLPWENSHPEKERTNPPCVWIKCTGSQWVLRFKFGWLFCSILTNRT